MWMICKTLHVLPSDPNFRNLTPAQIYWCFYNIVDDAESQRKILSGEDKQVSVGMDDKDFIAMVENETKNQK